MLFGVHGKIYPICGALRACIGKGIERYAQHIAKNKGIKAPVFISRLKLSRLPNGTCLTDLDDSGNPAYWESLAELKALKKTLPVVHRLTLEISLLRLCATIAVLYHELGHAKFHELYPEKNSHLSEYCGFSSLWEAIQERHFKKHYKDLFAEELYADAAIPDSLPLLKSVRDMHALVAQDLEFPEIGKAGETIDFSAPMDESLAKACDCLRYEWQHSCLSSYRRAHGFNVRLNGRKYK
jgi:hypothetical protein